MPAHPCCRCRIVRAGTATGTWTHWVNWSVGLLPDDQRRVFENCCVFAGAVAVEDAAVVLDTGSATGVQLADPAERSLLGADLTANSARYRMLQPRFDRRSPSASNRRAAPA